MTLCSQPGSASFLTQGSQGRYSRANKTPWDGDLSSEGEHDKEGE